MYKFPENSEDERQAWEKAYAFGSRPDYCDRFMKIAGIAYDAI